MFLSDGRFVAGVTNAGAMAFITARSFPEPKEFERQLRICFDLTRGRPFGVNFSFSGQAENNAYIAEHLRIALSWGVRHFETAGLLSVETMDAIHAVGGIVLHKVSRLRHAVAAERAGADAVGIVGMEEGGHPGTNELTTIVMCAAAASTLKIPYAIGGGIGTGSQLLAALAMGADAVLIGSRFVVADEIWAHDAYKDHVASLDYDCSTTALSTIGSTWRVLRNDTVRAVQDFERQGKTDFSQIGHLIKGVLARDHCYTDGDWNTGMISLGSAAGFANKRAPVAEIIAELLTGANRAAERLGAIRSQTLERGPEQAGDSELAWGGLYT